VQGAERAISSPEVSVVVATRDRAARLGGLLRSLHEQTLDPSRFEAVIVDDGSTDGTQALLERESAASGLRLRALRIAGSGPAAARNAGWRAAEAELVAFTDDDCEADPDWLEAGLAAAAQDRGAIVQGRTAPLPRELDRMGPFSRTRTVSAPGLWFETCNIFYPRQLLERLDGFDETFPEALGEDTDLGWRALAAGAKRGFAADALVYHAVDRLPVLDHLRTALRGPDAVLVFRRHPRLRREAIHYGAFRNPAHAQLLLAVGGLWLSRSLPLAGALALPYALTLARRARAVHGGPLAVPYLALYDALQTYASARGSLRHRVLAI
jgi:glycosyltransferase involved in cell wall biosynthesis